MKKLIVSSLVSFSMPFLLIWMAYFLTGFSFSPREIFQDSGFWGLSLVYWMFFMPFIVGGIMSDESL
jgi:hypothetical protein